MRLIYVSPVPWASFSQRPHHFVNWYHDRTGAAVLWIDPYPTRLPSLDDLRFKRPVAEREPISVPHWLTVCAPAALPIEPIPGAAVLLNALWRGVFRQVTAFTAGETCQVVIGKPCELAVQLLAHLPQCPALYDAMDDFPAFYRGLSRAAMERRQQRILRQVEAVLVSSTTLRDKLTHVADKVEMVRNACDPGALPPVEHLDLGPKHHVIGYVGTIGRWFDWQLVIALAQANPTCPFRLIGPVFTPPPCALPANIELLPECSHTSAIAMMATFSVGLIPFRLDRLTASVDPIKYYEYRALGLPVISTRFGEMAHRAQEPGVWMLDADSDLRSTVNQALANRCERADLAHFRQQNRWVSRFSEIRVLKPLHAPKATPRFDLQPQ
ncbi:glycosyl transferase [Pseudomonas putida]